MLDLIIGNGDKVGRAETDIDCGGPCNKCSDSKKCLLNEDCVSGLCRKGVCLVSIFEQPNFRVNIGDGLSSRARWIPSCTDNVKNGNEAGVDCGGSCANACPAYSSCNISKDCVSGICRENRCRLPVELKTPDDFRTTLFQSLGVNISDITAYQNQILNAIKNSAGTQVISSPLLYSCILDAANLDTLLSVSSKSTDVKETDKTKIQVKKPGTNVGSIFITMISADSSDAKNFVKDLSAAKTAVLVFDRFAKDKQTRITNESFEFNMFMPGKANAITLIDDNGNETLIRNLANCTACGSGWKVITLPHTSKAFGREVTTCTSACNSPPACYSQTCDPNTDSCVNTKLADGTTCDDKDACTSNDKCTNGVCKGTGTCNSTQGNSSSPLPSTSITTASPSPSPATVVITTRASSSSGLSGGAIAGIVVGTVIGTFLLVFIIAGILYFFVKSNESAPSKMDYAAPTNAQYPPYNTGTYTPNHTPY
eukprot:NODE_1297_length_2025_cov_1.904311_g1098_i0.p1 GENE.NODE_1297_length_2025_cov_1.904311_g1098_i0~~NODE_1297_length_2025_cov_1.904311_g1098_i0.p1  ORF type:complete len:482 (-),score=88.69 NODE_1297_length_2025_cov_1.904311_g1098_i0:196-1641(-)